MTNTVHETPTSLIDKFMIGLTIDDISDKNPEFTLGMSEIYTNNLDNGHFDDFLFIHIAKTAGVSINNSLGIHGRMHLTAEEFRKTLGDDKFQQLFKFAIVRNPWDRAVSQYSHLWSTMHADFPSFNDWVKIVYGEVIPNAYKNRDKFFTFKYKNNTIEGLVKPYMPQLDWLRDNNGKMLVNFVGRHENLQDDFNTICDKIGIARRILPHNNASKREGDYRSYYDKKSKKLVGDFFQKEIKKFSYKY